METEQIDADPCIGCGTVLRKRHRPDGERTSQPGDISICAHCGVIMMITDDMKRRPVTADEMEVLKSDPKFLDAVRFIANHLPTVN